MNDVKNIQRALDKKKVPHFRPQLFDLLIKFTMKPSHILKIKAFNDMLYEEIDWAHKITTLSIKVHIPRPNFKMILLEESCVLTQVVRDYSLSKSKYPLS